MLPYGEVWAYKLGRSQYSKLLTVILPVSCLCLPYFPKLVLKVVTFYEKFSLEEPSDPAYNIDIWRLKVVQKIIVQNIAFLIKNLYDTALALYYLDGQE